MTVTRTVNGKPVNEENMSEYKIVNTHVIRILYNAQRRARAERENR